MKQASNPESSRHVLLVDDDRLVLATLKQGLIGAGYTVTAFDNGQAALQFFEKTPPDIVVLDVRMPGLSGPEVARRMLATAYRPIVMLSAYDDGDTVKEAIGTGVAGYLVKPIEVNQLTPTIEATLARFTEVNALMRDSANLREGVEKNRVISTAVGIVMERGRLGQDMAFERLRKLARDQRRPLGDVAMEMIAATQTANALATTAEFDRSLNRDQNK